MELGNKIFDMLNGFGFRIKMFNENGDITTDAEDCTRFFSESPNILISIEPDGNILKLSRGKEHELEEIEPIRKRVKELAGDSMMKFEYKIFNKNVTPRDQAYQVKREQMESMNELRKLAGLEEAKPDFLDLDGDGDKKEPMKKAAKDKKKKDEGRIEDTFDTKRIDKHDKPEKKKKEKVDEGFGKLSGSRKTSYQPLGNSVKIVVRHKKEVDEEVRGSRSRDISRIFIERAGERFRFPVNSMIGARAMARHMSNGGEMHDTVAGQIVEMTENLSNLRQFLNAVKSKNLMNEENSQYVELAVENLLNSRDILKSLAGATTYSRAISELEMFSENEVIEEEVTDLFDKFKETFIDNRIEGVLSSLNKFSRQRETFETKVNEELANADVSKGFYKTLNPESNLTEWLNEMSSIVKGNSLKYLLMNSARKIKNNVSLSEFETSTIKKIMAGKTSQINESVDYKSEFTDFIENIVKDI